MFYCLKTEDFILLLYALTYTVLEKILNQIVCTVFPFSYNQLYCIILRGPAQYKQQTAFGHIGFKKGEYTKSCCLFKGIHHISILHTLHL